MKKKCLSLIISMVLAITPAMQAMAFDSQVTVTGGKTESVEKIDTEKERGADVKASEGKVSSLDVKESVNVKPESGEGAIGIEVSATDRGSADVEVGGNVAVDYPGEIGEPSSGIAISAEDNGSADVDVGGDVSVVVARENTAYGVEAIATNNSSIDFSAEGIGSKSEFGCAYGIDAKATDGSSERFDIGANGIQASGGEGGGGIRINSADSSVTVNVKGDIRAEGNDAIGIDIDAREASKVNVNVGGDITTDTENGVNNAGSVDLKAAGDGTEISIRVIGNVNDGEQESSVGITAEDGARVNVVAEGTLSAGTEAAVAFAGSPDNISLVIWKAETAEDGSLVKEKIQKKKDSEGGSVLQQTKNAEKLERSIHYIIKVDTSQSIELGNTTVMTYTAPDGEVINYDTAKADEKVAVKLNVPKDFELKGVFSDEDRKCSLKMDDEGNYYLMVPKGGGVFVNMWLVEKTKSDNRETSDDSGDDEPVPVQGTKSDSLSDLPQTMEMTDIGLRMSFPEEKDRFILNLNDVQTYIAANVQNFVVITDGGDVLIPVSDLLPYLQGGMSITFIRKDNGVIEVSVNGESIKSYAVQQSAQQTGQQSAQQTGQQSAYQYVQQPAYQHVQQSTTQNGRGPMVVKNNIAIVEMQNRLNNNSQDMSSSLAKVAAGMRINTASDDASGYAISQRMKVQIEALDRQDDSSRNTNGDAMSNDARILQELKQRSAGETNSAVLQKAAEKLLEQ